MPSLMCPSCFDKLSMRAFFNYPHPEPVEG
jgi:hypothetical protein